MKTTDDFEVNDVVDVFAMENDDFLDFTGRVSGIVEGEYLEVTDQDNDVFHVSPNQCVLSKDLDLA